MISDCATPCLGYYTELISDPLPFHSPTFTFINHTSYEYNTRFGEGVRLKREPMIKFPRGFEPLNLLMDTPCVYDYNRISLSPSLPALLASRYPCRRC